MKENAHFFISRFPFPLFPISHFHFFVPGFTSSRREVGIHSNTQTCTRLQKSGGTNQIAVSASVHVKYIFTSTRSTLPPTSCNWHTHGRRTRERISLAGGLLGYPSTKQEQLDVARAFLEGKDVFAVLPTGFGKSLHVLCFAYLPAALDIFKKA